MLSCSTSMINIGCRLLTSHRQVLVSLKTLTRTPMGSIPTIETILTRWRVSSAVRHVVGRQRSMLKISVKLATRRTRKSKKKATMASIACNRTLYRLTRSAHYSTRGSGRILDRATSQIRPKPTLCIKISRPRPTGGPRL